MRMPDRSLRAAGVAALLLALGVPRGALAVSGGRDDCAPCTRHAGAEYQAAHARSKQLADLNCVGLAAYSEWQRQCFNRQALSVYLRPVVMSAPTTEPAPSSFLNSQPPPLRNGILTPGSAATPAP